jgi:hypothetical protein
MTYEEFENECRAIVGRFEMMVPTYNGLRKPYWNKQEETTPCLYAYWTTGGMRGGSCWGGVAQPYTSSDAPAELTELDSILEKFKPDMSFLQYRALTNALVKFGEDTDHDYYGNSTNYATKALSIRSLYDYMVEKEWL